MFYFDPVYMIIIVITALLSGGASLMVKSNFARGEKVRLSRNISGAEVAQKVLQSADIRDVKIVQSSGFLSDHYNPATKTLALSKKVYTGRNAAAAGVAAHEVGHAIQHARGYAPLGFRSAIVPVANLGSRLGPWIVIIGIFLGSSQGSPIGRTMAIAGVILFGVATFFTLITVPVEFNASARAKERLMSLGIIGQGKESAAVSGVLTAAGLTYVAAAVNSLLMLLYWASRAGLLGRSRD
ncbi:MAG: zinc metallopeptidase [Spirochaetales bacterium]|nr:zinc metallopeptidase [Spirochaetales bacterium]